jgi:UDP-N-acetyl-D-mannosaminuronate dehydrogenase
MSDKAPSADSFPDAWVREIVWRFVSGADRPVVALLGLTTSEQHLHSSPAVELCRWLHHQNVRVRAHDAAVYRLPPDLEAIMELAHGPLEALDGAHVAVVASDWLGYRNLRTADINARMRRPAVVDPCGHLKEALAGDPRIIYVDRSRHAA